MKIVYMGTPEFAIPGLEKLLNSSHKIIAVVTGPDKQVGRGRADKGPARGADGQGARAADAGGGA